jgi:hypothetical protein
VSAASLPDSAIVAIASDVLASELGSEVVMLSLRDGIYYGLDAVGAEVWRLVQSPSTIGHIVATIVDTFDVEEERCRADVVALIATLRDRQLVHVRERA